MILQVARCSFLLLAILSTASAATHDGQADAPDEAIGKKIRPPDKIFTYKATPQGELKMNVFLPGEWKASDKRPAILFFHGGGWTGGKPSQLFPHADYFAGRGLLAICPEYRVLSTHKTTPEKSHADSRSAMRYVRAHAAELGVDPGRIVAMGSSAGANLALALDILNSHDDPADDLAIACRPQAVVALAPCPDTSDKGSRWKDTPDADRGPELAMSISLTQPLTNGCAPALIIQGTADVYLPKTRVFVAKSRALGNRVEFDTAAGQPHSFHVFPPWLQTTLITVDHFLKSLGYTVGEPAVKPAEKPAVLVRE